MPKLKQIQIAFAPLEDRLLLRISTSGNEEFRFWITRRYLKVLWRVITKILIENPQIRTQSSEEAQRSVLSFQHEKAVQEADFSTAFDESGQTLPLGGTPVLLSRIQSKRGSDGGTVICLHPEKGQGVEIAVNDSILHALSRLVIQAVAQTDWDLQLHRQAPSARSNPQQRTLN